MKNLYMIMALAAVASQGCRNTGKDSVPDAGAADTTAVVQPDTARLANKENRIMEKIKELPEEPVFDIVTNRGTIRVKLYSDTPRHRDNFARLALGDYYNKVRFHRVISGFMIQAGDPLSKDDSQKDYWGTGGPDYTIPAEFIPGHKHKKGALAAARRGDAANPFRESSGSQFYIVQSETGCSHLDGQYTVFGETVGGLDVIDKIAGVRTDFRDRPLEDIIILEIKPVK